MLSLLLARRAAGSIPGLRTDGARVALVLEGGGNRAAYSAGMAMALEEVGLLGAVDAVYGTSGGALNGAWILTGEGQRWLPLWASPEYAAQRVVDVRRLLRGRPVVDLRMLLHRVYVDVFPMDFDAILASPLSLHPIATDAATGLSVDLSPTVRDVASLQDALRASASLPLLAGQPVQIAGRRYVDGGLAEPIPFRTALQQGATHVLVLRTRRADQAAEPPSRLQRWGMSAWFAAFGPGAGDAYRRRHLLHVEDERLLEDLEGRGTVLQVRPAADAPDVSRLSGDLNVVGRAIDAGRQQLLAAVTADAEAAVPPPAPRR